MAMRTEDVRRQALALADEERAELAAELLASLEGPAGAVDDGLEVAWAEEIERRALAVISGESQAVPWETARVSIADELTG
jgi:putative addiction module component (TIGR02574 family)